MGGKPRVQAEVLCSPAISDGDDQAYLVCALAFSAPGSSCGGF